MPQVSSGQEGPLLFQRELEDAIYSVNPDGSNLRKVADGRHPLRSPDGRFTLVTRRGAIVSISSGGEEVVAMEAGDDYTWSPDGKRIAFQRGGNLFMVNRDGTEERLLVEGGEGGGWRPLWSPVDPMVVYYNRTRPTSMDATDLFMVNIATGKSKLVLEYTFIPQVPYPVSPDGTSLFIARSGSEAVEVMNLKTGEFMSVGQSGGAQRPAWSPDGNRIVFEMADGVGGLHLRDLRDQTVRELVPGRGEAVPGGAVWSPKGEVIAFHLMNWMEPKPSRICLINVDGTYRMRRLAEGSWPLWASMPSAVYPNTVTIPSPLTWGTLKYQLGP